MIQLRKIHYTLLFVLGVGCAIAFSATLLFTPQTQEYAASALVGCALPPQPEVPTTTRARSAPESQAVYVEIIAGCAVQIDKTCTVARSGPGPQHATTTPLRVGAVLRVDTIVKGADGPWYKVRLDEWLRYPSRVTSDWYIAAEDVRLLRAPAPQQLNTAAPATTSEKRILVDRSQQMLYAYEDGALFLQTPISTGLSKTPTPRGEFTVYYKTPSRYMQGPIPGISGQYFDLPGVPWNLYFTQQGGVIHGAYWHESFGKQYSNGCVNVPLKNAQKLFEWAELGTPVVVQD